jgi:hypothetical protein
MYNPTVILWVVSPCDAVGVFQRGIGTYRLSTLNMEAMRSSETLVTAYKTTRRQTREDSTQLYSRQNFGAY